MTKTKKYMANTNYIRLVKNALRNINANKNYVTNILIPKIPGSLQNLLNRGNLSFYSDTHSNDTKAKILTKLINAGINKNSATNLVRKLIASKNSGAARATPQRPKRKTAQNGGAPSAAQVHRRSGRTAGRV
jgi:hypothetical protein